MEIPLEISGVDVAIYIWLVEAGLSPIKKSCCKLTKVVANRYIVAIIFVGIR